MTLEGRHPGGIVIEVTLPNEEGDDVTIYVPARYIVCPRCRGKGTHVNPAVDGNGLTAEDIEEAGGDDFLADYLGGTYDVTCYECHGERVVKEVDRERADPTELRLYERHLEEEDWYDTLEKMERQAGA